VRFPSNEFRASAVSVKTILVFTELSTETLAESNVLNSIIVENIIFIAVQHIPMFK